MELCKFLFLNSLRVKLNFVTYFINFIKKTICFNNKEEKTIVKRMERIKEINIKYLDNGNKSLTVLLTTGKKFTTVYNKEQNIYFRGENYIFCGDILFNSNKDLCLFYPNLHTFVVLENEGNFYIRVTNETIKYRLYYHGRLIAYITGNLNNKIGEVIYHSFKLVDNKIVYIKENCTLIAGNKYFFFYNSNSNLYLLYKNHFYKISHYTCFKSNYRFITEEGKSISLPLNVNNYVETKNGELYVISQNLD